MVRLCFATYETRKRFTEEAAGLSDAGVGAECYLRISDDQVFQLSP